MPQKAAGGLPQTAWYEGSPRALRLLTSRFLGAKVEFQIEVFHHVAQLVIVGIFPQLQGRGGGAGGGEFRGEEEHWQLDCHPPHTPPFTKSCPGSYRGEPSSGPGRNWGPEETAGEAGSSKL